MRVDRRHPGRIGGSLIAALAVCAASAVSYVTDAAPGERFPELKPATRVQAISALTGGATLPVPCLTPRLESLGGGAPAAWRRAVGVLETSGSLSRERLWLAPDGTRVRYTLDSGSFDRIAARDTDGDALPDVVLETYRGTRDAARLLVERLGLPAPGPLDIVLADVRSLDGFTIRAGGSRQRTLLVLDSTPASGFQAAQAAAHQYAHAVAASAGAVPAGWAEALAQWTVMSLEGEPTLLQRSVLSARVARLSEGLLTDDLELAAGNALWLAFLEEAYGLASVRLAVVELASGDAPAEALDRAVRKAAGGDLENAFRDFHLWTVLVGDRADGLHFSFGRAIVAAPFVATADGMPELSVQADPPIVGLGASSILIRPRETEGGITVLFEGAISGRWEADLLLSRADGSLQRVAMPLSDETRAELTVPLDGLDELMLLVRNLSTDEPNALRYTWSIHRERDFPFELVALEASFVEASGGVLVSWETLVERRLMGFNVVRNDESTGESTRINPVWVPAVGDGSSSMAYQFLDATARSDGRYLYRVEGITLEGLTSRSEPVAPR